MSSVYNSQGFMFTQHQACTVCKTNRATIRDEVEPEGTWRAPYPDRYYCLQCFKSLGGKIDYAETKLDEADNGS